MDERNTIRRQKGMEIAARSPITQKGSAWLVPSQSGKRKYTVCLHPENPHCTCLDHGTTGLKCKHIFAVEIMIQREHHPDGTTTIRERVTFPSSPRKTYPQDWPAYNAAQTNEKHKFQALLFDLCQTVEDEPVGKKKGRPRIPIADAIFAVAAKVYSTFSSRRCIGDLRDAHDRGFISHVPHFNTISNYLDNASLSPILMHLVTLSSLPLKAIENDFAVDSTGFTTNRFVPWYDSKYRKWDKREHDWVKVHLMTGVKTNIVTAVEIHERDASDTKILPSLLATTAQYFNVREVSADKGYSSVNNHKVITQYGARPFIPFKSNATGSRGGLWEEAFLFFYLKREEFLAHYHKRSNVESTVSMIKAKFRDDVRSRTDTARTNEVLAKVLCHNICCLIQSIYELGIDPSFLTGEA